MGRGSFCRLAVGVFAALLLGVWAGRATAGQGEPIRKILWGRQSLEKHKDADHQADGRIAGTVRNCPECLIELINASEGVIQSIYLKRADGSYSTQWVDEGAYTLRVSADGYPLVTVQKITVEAGSETSLNLAFIEKPPRPKSEPGSIPDDIERMPDWKPSGGPVVPRTDFKPGIPKDLQPKNRDRDDENNRRKGKGRKGRNGRRKGRNNRGVKILGK